jgi:methyl-accepting chemotaxis protein
MIKETLRNVDDGMKLSREMEVLFKDIIANSKKVLEMNQEVEGASKQQDEGINQVSTAMVQFDTVVQANASEAEETASAAEEMNGQVVTIEKVVAQLYEVVTGKLKDSHEEKTENSPRKALPNNVVHARKSAAAKSPAPAAGKNPANKDTRLISFEDDEDFS